MTTSWYPLRLSTPVKSHLFGGRVIADQLRRTDVPDGRVAETWEVSDVDGDVAEVTNGAWAGRSLRELVREHPAELVGRGWSGDRFPLLTKFIDATGVLPVHLHADDEAARRLEGEPNGKTEAWHILAAAPGATVLCGVRDGVGETELREALRTQDFDSVLRRLPVRAGDTVYVPGGTLHSFGPDTLVYEIQQTSDIGQHAMTRRMEDGSPVDEAEHRANLDLLMQECRLDLRPDPIPGLRLASSDAVHRTVLCAGPFFALERWSVIGGAELSHEFATAVVLSNVGASVTVTAGSWAEELATGRTLLLPAALGSVQVSGPADVLLGYVPDRDRDVRQPLELAGYGPAVISALGEMGT